MRETSLFSKDTEFVLREAGSERPEMFGLAKLSTAMKVGLVPVAASGLVARRRPLTYPDYRGPSIA